MFNPVPIPHDVIEVLRSIFVSANLEVAGRLARNPFYHEPALDMTMIDALAAHGTPFYTKQTNSLVQVTTHFIGNAPHWGKWEIADIGLIIEVYVYGTLRLKKTAVLQSKRLYARNDKDETEKVRLKLRWGFGGLQGSHNPLPAEPTRAFQFTDASVYAKLDIGGEQSNRIHDYEGEFGIPVHYLLYNPTHIPHTAIVPAQGQMPLVTSNLVGCRVLRSETIRALHPGNPSYGDVKALAPPHEHGQWAAGWRVEDFVVDLCLGCHEGRLAADNDLGLEFLFNRRTGPIASAVSVQIDVRSDGDLDPAR